MHFTYAEPHGDLCQGDVLKRTDALEAVLREVHPHYLSEDYKLFMLLTQTCDLVRRGGAPCSARYINLASVRPLDVVLQRHIETFQGDEFERRFQLCSEKHRDKFLQFIRSLLNNNATDYFFLRQDVTLGIQDNFCTFLRESIPLRSRQHYQTMIDARIASLQPTFQAKLGWLVGNIFGRVATDDWVPGATNEEAFTQLATAFADQTCDWIEARKLKQVKRDLQKEPTLADDEIRERVKKARSVSQRNEVMTRVCAVIKERYPDDFERLRNLQQTLESDPELKSLL